MFHFEWDNICPTYKELFVMLGFEPWVYAIMLDFFYSTREVLDKLQYIFLFIALPLMYRRCINLSAVLYHFRDYEFIEALT